ncbi:MAG: N-6 DNA methylase, partial [FCB group bacterium]|nr:N-6 DNA methylase [FCB group bacterium]
GIPPLFREIFKNAYLPYRDPETLRAFLKIIGEFNYDHSERLGDAFEYLLSVLGSQGDAGQFRTPRHIIDFMVEILDPKKTETVLDPACGTAGFLISAYKHILRKHDPSDRSNPSDPSPKPLTPEDRGRLAQNFKGYDISPDMVRLSLVNLYLHGFVDPHIFEYDTLTSQDRWNEYADVILANPPFMSPKGGIKPHTRFTVQSKRSEVLFVDYMAEHLTPNGRAAIIVPEGVIFQSQTAYKQLRKLLVDDYLVAVVSLPAGVFNPYSGVKTSILFLDKSLAKKTSAIAFIKIENDGFGLGAQRREIEKNDLPAAANFLKSHLQSIASGKSIESIPNPLIVDKTKIAANGDYNLSGERYRENGACTLKWPMVELGEVCETILTGPFGSSLHQGDYIVNGIPVINPQNIVDGVVIKDETKTVSSSTRDRLKEFTLRENDIVIARRGEMGRCAVVAAEMNGWICGTGSFVIRLKATCDVRFVFFQLTSPKVKAYLEEQAVGVTLKNLNQSILSALQIPLPPLEVQKEIVAEIEGYQKVINGARAVLDHYRPHIPIHPDWPIVELGKLFETRSGTTPSRSHTAYFEDGTIPWVKTLDLTDGPITSTHEKITQSALDDTHLSILPVGTVLIAMYGGFNQIGRTGVLEIKATHNQAMTALLPTPKVSPYYLNTILAASKGYWKTVANSTRKDPNITKSDVLMFKLPLPPLATQQAIVAEIEAEQALVAANRELIARFENKIQATLARIWGADDPSKA